MGQCVNANRIRFSGFALMQPYIEGNAIANAFNYSLVCTSPSNTTARYTTIPAFLCPSDLPSTGEVGVQDRPGFLRHEPRYAGKHLH